MRLIRYLTQDLVDLTLFTFFVIVLIKNFIEKWYEINIAILAANIFIILYILGTTWRIGNLRDIANEIIRDNAVRKRLKLNVFSLRYRRKKKYIMGWVWYILVTAVFVYVLLINK